MKAARLIASGFGLGFAPRAPGTVASAAALALGALLKLASPGFLPLATLVVIIAGMWAIGAVERETGDAIGDPGWIVIDEVAGQFVALLGLARLQLGWLSVAGLAGAFLLFRLLDIAKPGPVGWADRQRGPAAVMGDDLVAGAITAGILWAIGRWVSGGHFPGLFG